jgi:gluconolactonase
MEVISEGHVLAEAPRELADGSVVFSDVVAGGVHRIEPEGGAAQTLIAGRRGIGGLLPGRGDALIVGGRDLAVAEPGGEPRTLLAPEGSTGINDLTSDGAGGVLAGVLRFRPMAGEDPVAGEVWHVPAGDEPRVLARDVLWPNGIGRSPDGGTLYVSDFAQSLVLAYDADGAGRRIFARAPRGSCDGLAVDADGGVWVALGPGGGIARFSADGTLDELLELPGAFVSSLVFAGPDLRGMIVTTATQVLRGDAPVAGSPVPAATLG